MQYYYAPLEGLTDSIYRRLHARYFPGAVDRYYTPFFSPTIHRSLTPREARELPQAPAELTIPQVLTKNVEDLLWFASVCADRGYTEINLNLGCPSGTVVSKGKGSDMLRDLDALSAFLDRVCSDSPLPVSVKTRIGLADPEEFPALLAVLNRYPLQELILHPRTRADFYEGPIHMASFRYAAANSTAPLCYNGSLCSRQDCEAFARAYPRIGAVMLGRGLIGDPGMLLPEGTQVDRLEAFYQELLENYLSAFGGSRNAMFRMKENWRYLLPHFAGSEKLGKQLRKTTDLAEYRLLTARIFHSLPLTPVLMPNW